MSDQKQKRPPQPPARELRVKVGDRVAYEITNGRRRERKVAIDVANRFLGTHIEEVEEAA